MEITVDIGNSRIKWALWQAGVIIARGVKAYDVKAHDGQLEPALLDSLFEGLHPPRQVFAVCVAGDAHRHALQAWLQDKWQLEAAFLATQASFEGIRHAYDQPENHGADRWAGLVAASKQNPGESVCVIGAGTALTVDMVTAQGEHLGGYIMPSLDSMMSALLSSTHAIESITGTKLQAAGPVPEAGESLPADTVSAVSQGVHRMMRAAVVDVCRQAHELLPSPCKIVLTGGFAKTILGYADMPAMVYRPDLVMQGLYLVMHTQSCSHSGDTKPGGESFMPGQLPDKNT